MKSQSLQSFLQRAKANGTPIPSSFEMSLALDIIQGIKYVATRQLLHKDTPQLTSSHFFIDESKSLKIAYYGIGEVTIVIWLIKLVTGQLRTSKKKLKSNI